MKMLFVTDLYPVKEDEKTTPRTLYDFVKGFRDEGVEVDVIKPNFVLNSFLRKKPFYKTRNYESCFNVNYWLPFLGDVTKKTVGSVSFDSYDVVVSHMPSGSIFSYKVAKKYDLPLVCGVHVSDIEVLTKPMYSLYFRRELLNAFRYAKFLACRSYVIKDKLAKIFPEFADKLYVMPSGIDEELIVAPDVNRAGKKRLKVLTCANFKKRKNIDKIIKACRSLENIDLTVVGDGKGRKKLEKLDPSVTFCGRLGRAEVLIKMRESDVFILPSVNETFGMVYLEAMSQNCITICTEHDGIAGIIKDGENGFLVAPNVEVIAQKLLYIQKMDANSIKSIHANTFETIQNYTSKKMTRHYLQQIFKIL